MRRRAMQSVFILSGLALIITGMNNSRALMIAGISLVLVGLMGRRLGGREG